MSLKEYRRKRDFESTSEPEGKHSGESGHHRFVVQKHAATRLHYDFRLELDGVLKSWAVPKGIPFVKGEKRLAVQVEDHPLSYIYFEGTIPKGQYGGGTVMVWDRGRCKALTANPGKDLAAGKLHFELKGKKLKGEWHLVRLRDGKQWLLIRGSGNMRPVSRKNDDLSALSGRTMRELAEGGRVWHSEGKRKSSRPAVRSKQIPAPSLKFIEPMKARLVETPPHGDWIYEVKLDGFRTMALKSDGDVRLLSRNERDFGGRFPGVRDAVAKIHAGDALIDGEIVALDPKGRSDFQLLQAYEQREERPPIFLYAFDLLQLNGKDLRNEPLTARKALLARLLKKAPPAIRYSASLEGPVAQLLKEAKRLGLEGLIGKRKDSAYEAGRRTGAWIKLKLLREQEMVIGGYTDPEGSRGHFGAVLVGYHEGKHLLFAGKVGTGFNEALLKDLHDRFRRIARKDCPFANLPEKPGASSSAGLTAREMKRCHWVKPELVCQVRFSEWTRDGKLRQPVFLGLREDKAASEVVRETPD